MEGGERPCDRKACVMVGDCFYWCSVSAFMPDYLLGLEKKQKRDREASISAPVPPATVAAEPVTVTPSRNVVSSADSSGVAGVASTTSNFQRQGSYKHATLMERIIDPQNVKPAG